jgi:multicomponent Na+:H+ antiporter subunit E
MVAFLVTSVVAFLLYLLLTLFSGSLGAWSAAELIAGAALALIAGWLAHTVTFEKERTGKKSAFRMLNPLRLILFLIYLIGPFFVAMARANLDVAYRIITGKIRPGIVKLSPALKTDLGITLLANSITLTPGTLSVDVDEEVGDLYVHWIYVTDLEPSAKAVCGSFPAWARRIAE